MTVAGGARNHVATYACDTARRPAKDACRGHPDRGTGMVYPQGTLALDAVTVVIGVATWAVFAFALHTLLIGRNPFA